MASTARLYHCTKCGACCRGFGPTRGVVLFPEDIQKISSALAVTPTELSQSYCVKTPVETALGKIDIHILKHKEGACIFLQPDSSCSIYQFRPIQCRRGPFAVTEEKAFTTEYECLKNVKAPSQATRVLDADLLDTLFLTETGDKNGRAANSPNR